MAQNLIFSTYFYFINIAIKYNFIYVCKDSFREMSFQERGHSGIWYPGYDFWEMSFQETVLNRFMYVQIMLNERFANLYCSNK